MADLSSAMIDFKTLQDEADTVRESIDVLKEKNLAVVLGHELIGWIMLKSCKTKN